ncbi:energy transducer TonB [Frankia sp. Mgl5]|uniref:energy transducer TonB n=1 Tax=Frankia sp. Mgl5 TaxID=2933793 RepID=UPI00200C44D7|nr:energy transducer TonB [Frankia sp. Mgl5]MCK9929627.1 energy transducer TonB [Frankia sp. Mgl5]
MAMMPYETIGDSRSRLNLVLQAHPAEDAEIQLPKNPDRFAVLRPVLMLPGGVQVTVDPNAPLDVAGKWWDSLTVAGTLASLWYKAQVSGFPGGPGRHRRDGGQ